MIRRILSASGLFASRLRASSQRLQSRVPAGSEVTSRLRAASQKLQRVVLAGSELVNKHQGAFRFGSAVCVGCFAVVKVNSTMEQFEQFMNPLKRLAMAAEMVAARSIAPWCGDYKKLAQEYEKAVSIFSSHDPPVILVKVDANEEENKGLANDYDFKGFTIKILRDGDKAMLFLNFSSDGKVPACKKSEPIPEKNDEPVKVVVAESLDDIVFKSGKNVLIEFYAPWCGHCKKLAPILEEVAVSFEKDPGVLIGKYDATANDVPSEFDVKYYPTLYFKTASGKLLSYDEDDRTKESLIAFIEKNRDKAETTTENQESSKDEL